MNNKYGYMNSYNHDFDIVHCITLYIFYSNSGSRKLFQIISPLNHDHFVKTLKSA